MNRVTSVYTSKDMYNDRNSINTGVFRRKSGSTVSSRGTSSTERSVSKEDAVIGDFGQSHICPLFWNTNDVIMWLEYAGLDMAIDHFIGTLCSLFIKLLGCFKTENLTFHLFFILK
jgi:hypothetical protein